MGLRIAIYTQVICLALVGAVSRQWLPIADILIYLALVSCVVIPALAIWVVTRDHQPRWRAKGFWLIEAMLMVAYFMA
jgi:hypothetical protein